VTVQESKYDPDGQVVRSTQTVEENAKENKPDNTGQATVANNIPGGTGATQTDPTLNASGRTEETTKMILMSEQMTVQVPLSAKNDGSNRHQHIPPLRSSSRA
jgi:flagellar M-ring protein FliF